MKNKINFLIVLGILFCFSNVKSQTEKEFSKGWNEGYEAGYCEYNLLHHKMKPVFMTPFVSTYAIAYTTYQDGYKLGFSEGKEKFMKQCSDCNSDEYSTSSPTSGNGTFDEGWKTGYGEGYCEYNLLHHKMKPLFIVPIAPIPSVGYGTYRDGYLLGLQKGRENFQSK